MDPSPPTHFAYLRARVWKAAKGAIPLTNNYGSYVSPGLLAAALAWLGMEQVGPISALGVAIWLIVGTFGAWLIFFVWRLLVSVPYEMHTDAFRKAKSEAEKNETLVAMREGNRIASERLEIERQTLAQQAVSADNSRILVFEFLNECNEEHIESLFKRSKELFPSGHPIDRGQVSFNEFFVGIRNSSSTKTAKNVRVVVDAVGGVGTWPVDASLIADRTKTDVVDIPPGKTDFFLLGGNIANSGEGKFHPLIVQYDVYLQQVAERERTVHEGLRLHLHGRAPWPLLKNDGYKIELTAYADDVAPVQATFTVNARTNVAVLMN